MPGPRVEVDGRQHPLAAAHAQAGRGRAPGVALGGASSRSSSAALSDRAPGRAARRAARGIQHVEDVVGRGDALGRGVELHADLPQRQVRLGREQQHEQADARARASRR